MGTIMDLKLAGASDCVMDAINDPGFGFAKAPHRAFVRYLGDAFVIVIDGESKRYFPEDMAGQVITALAVLWQEEDATN